jgi:hypothetical protein
MVLTLFYSISLNPLLPAVFMTGAESVATVTVRPADALQDEMNAIIDHNPKAVFLAVNTPAPHAIDNHLHRFDNTSDFYLAHIFFNAPTPQDAINALRHDDITHLLYRIPNADAEGLLNICRARGSACPLYQAVIEKKEELRVLLHAVVEKNNTVIYEL